MKKLIITGLTLFALNGIANNQNDYLCAVPTYTKIVKSNGGFFGYRDVGSTTTGNGSGGTNVILACSEPGLRRCRMSSTTNFTTNGLLSEEDYNQIDQQVVSRLAATNGDIQNGKFVYNSAYLVVYNFKISSNELTYEIYTRDEAIQAGYTF